MSPTLNEISAIQQFKHSNVLEIRDRITFDFYMGLPHICKNKIEAAILHFNDVQFLIVRSVISLLISQSR